MINELSSIKCKNLEEVLKSYPKWRCSVDRDTEEQVFSTGQIWFDWLIQGSFLYLVHKETLESGCVIWVEGTCYDWSILSYNSGRDKHSQEKETVNVWLVFMVGGVSQHERLHLGTSIII